MGEKEIHRMLPEGRENAERGLFAGNETVNESARGLEVDGMKETMERVGRKIIEIGLAPKRLA